MNRSADVPAFVCDQALDFERSEVSFPNISTHVYLLVLLSIFWYSGKDYSLFIGQGK